MVSGGICEEGAAVACQLSLASLCGKRNERKRKVSSESCRRGALGWLQRRREGWGQLPDRLLRPVSGDHTMLCENRVGTESRDRCLTEVIRS